MKGNPRWTKGPSRCDVCYDMADVFCTRRTMMCCLCFLIILGCLTISFINIIQPPWDAKDELGLSFTKKFPDAKVQRDFDLTQQKLIERDLEWQHALVNNPIIDTVLIGHHGLAKKYIFILEGGYVAMAKPVERNQFFYPHAAFPTLQWDYENPISAVRMDRDYQGWGELCGTALDRVLGWYRKPTVMGRYLDSKLLYYHDYSLLGRIQYALPSRNIPVAMHAWVTGLATRAPNDNMAAFLRNEGEDERIIYSLALEYSDILVFDFLLDDHDRLGSHNWKSSADRKMLVWDSGLAWNFGPKNADTEILCGTHLWNGDDQFDTPHDIKRPTCTRICKFRKDTILKLQYHGPTADPENKLGRLLEKELEKDVLDYSFEYGIFKVKPSGFFWWFYQSARFEKQDFFDGLDDKVQVLLDHVDECILKYGENNVLLN